LAVAFAVATANHGRAQPDATGSVSPEVAEPGPLVGDVENGATVYEVCSVCHLANGAGRPDGVFAQLAGQHASVLARQVADIRDGRRDSAVMYPFARTLNDPQTLADVSAYIASLPLPADNGKGLGSDYELGAKLYVRDCETCHGTRGQGDSRKLIPVIASQHYNYLLRQINDIAEGHRGNADPVGIAVVTGYSKREREAVADFISRLEIVQSLVPSPDD
jgi:cytochrome c553